MDRNDKARIDKSMLQRNFEISLNDTTLEAWQSNREISH